MCSTLYVCPTRPIVLVDGQLCGAVLIIVAIFVRNIASFVCSSARCSASRPASRQPTSYLTFTLLKYCLPPPISAALLFLGLALVPGDW